MGSFFSKPTATTAPPNAGNPASWLPPWAKPVAAAPGGTVLTTVVEVESLKKLDPLIRLALISSTTGAVSPWAEVRKGNAWQYGETDSTAALAGSLINKSYALAGQIEIPPNFGPVGAVLLRLSWPGSHAESVYVEGVTLTGAGTGPTIIPIHSYLFEQQATRVFFPTTGLITQKTPAALQQYREGDLAVVRGERISLDIADPPQAPFQSWNRVYQYDTYNDLGGDSVPPNNRPTLGGAELPYPRRLRTGRALNPDGTESKPGEEGPYLPKNETFTSIRAAGFSGDTFTNVVQSALSLFKTYGRSGVTLDSFDELYKWYSKEVTPSMIATPGALALTKQTGHKGLAWPSPKVFHHRHDMWRSDEEFGRQVLAGQNPITVAAVTSLTGTAFTSQTVPAQLLGGASLEEVLAAGAADPTACRLFVQDYSTVFLDYSDKVAAFGKEQVPPADPGRVLPGVRCLFFAEKPGRLMPVAIELQASPSVPAEVHTPLSGVGVWMLAKMFAATNDSASHQVVSHWLRTHACTEPFILASRRHLGLPHPLNRLLQKHFTYTLQINAKARGGLISANGIIEKTFSPGKYAMPIGSKAYGATWRFDQQALPADLVARGMAVPDASCPGGVRVLSSLDYPYADDGLALWALTEGWVRDYLACYYASDAEVLADKEVAAWWADIKTEGHPDKKEGWPELTGLDSLARIASTIIWLASGHHAAVNFGQYDFSGLLLNKSSKIRIPFPARDSPAYNLLASGANYAQLEGEILKYLASPMDFATVLSTVEVLSSHDPAEQYLGAPDGWMVDPSTPEVQARYAKYGSDLKTLEAEIDRRNQDPTRPSRFGPFVTPYTLLMPTSPEGGVTGRGVPNSISI